MGAASRAQPVTKSVDRGTAARDRARQRLAILLGISLAHAQVVHLLGRRVNISLSDTVLLAVLALSAPLWTRARALGYWLYAMVLVNLLAWVNGLAHILSLNTVVIELAKLAACFGFALAGYALARDRRAESAFRSSAVTTAGVVAAVGVVAVFTGWPASFASIGGRLDGAFDDPNLFAAYAAGLLPVALTTPLAAISVPLLGVAAVLTFSRSGLIALAVAVVVSTLLAGKRRALPIVILCVLLCIPLYARLSQSRLTEYQDTLQAREQTWLLATRTGVSHPWLGVGKGAFTSATESEVIPHNTLLSTFAETGVVGVFVFVIPLLYWTARGWTVPEARTWSVVIVVCLAAGTGISLNNFRFFWVATGMLVGRLAATPRSAWGVGAGSLKRREGGPG